MACKYYAWQGFSQFAAYRFMYRGLYFAVRYVFERVFGIQRGYILGEEGAFSCVLKCIGCWCSLRQPGLPVTNTFSYMTL